jgi:hypothetical protein
MRLHGWRFAVAWILLHELVSALVVFSVLVLQLGGTTDDKVTLALFWLGEWMSLTAVAQATFLSKEIPGIELLSWLGATLGSAVFAVPLGLGLGVSSFLFLAAMRAEVSSQDLMDALLFLLVFVVPTCLPGVTIGGIQSMFLANASLKAWPWIVGSGLGASLWFGCLVLGLSHDLGSTLSARAQEPAGLLIGTAFYSISTAISLRKAKP